MGENLGATCAVLGRVLRQQLRREHCIGPETLVGLRRISNSVDRRKTMTWTTPTLVEICIGLEINGYLPAEI